MLSRRRLWPTCVALLAALLCGCASNGRGHGGGFDVPEMRHVSPPRSQAQSVRFSGAESDLARVSLQGPQGFEISGLPDAEETFLAVSSEYEYSIFCDGQLVTSRAREPCREHNPYTYSEGCDYAPGVDAKIALINARDGEIYCEITPYFWRPYCNPDEQGDEDAAAHSHTYDGGGGCEWPSTQEILFYLHPTDS